MIDQAIQRCYLYSLQLRSSATEASIWRVAIQLSNQLQPIFDTLPSDFVCFIEQMYFRIYHTNCFLAYKFIFMPYSHLLMNYTQDGGEQHLGSQFRSAWSFLKTIECDWSQTLVGLFCHCFGFFIAYCSFTLWVKFSCQCCSCSMLLKLMSNDADVQWYCCLAVEYSELSSINYQQPKVIKLERT